MVKNFGGNKQKKQGRKFTNNRPNNALRLSECDDEMYGCITKLLGNGMANVRGIDNIERLLIIRNKFKGRGKRDNTLKPGTIVLYGDRSWETKVDNKIQKCDLLEVYSDIDKQRLQNDNTVDFTGFLKNDNIENVEYDDYIKFSNQTQDTSYISFSDSEDENENDAQKEKDDENQEIDVVLENKKKYNNIDVKSINDSLNRIDIDDI